MPAGLPKPTERPWPGAGRLSAHPAAHHHQPGACPSRRRFVHSQHLEAESVALGIHLHQGLRPPSPEATPLRLSRALEQRVADVEGPGEVRHWLQLIGHGEEHEWIDLGTVGRAGGEGSVWMSTHSRRRGSGAASPAPLLPQALIHLQCHPPLAGAQVKGYRRIVFCQSVRDDVDGALGSGAWADLLPRMCEGRLVPTPWLNKVSGMGSAKRLAIATARAAWVGVMLAPACLPACLLLSRVPAGLPGAAVPAGQAGGAGGHAHQGGEAVPGAVQVGLVEAGWTAAGEAHGLVCVGLAWRSAGM